jgi:hypothetical protein
MIIIYVICHLYHLYMYYIFGYDVYGHDIGRPGGSGTRSCSSSSVLYTAFFIASAPGALDGIFTTYSGNENHTRNIGYLVGW